MATQRPDQTRKWWKEGVGYQVWPQSFKDSNGDGIGDVPGLISKLDYLKDLGVDFVWMSPMYASPREDYGYDISDYEAVDPVFGTMEDMDKLIAGLHSRGMRLMLDLVVNHSSSKHKWFQASSKSRDNEYSNYYIWRDPKIVDGKKCPPNNWKAFFGGGAWEYVEARDQYYLGLFMKSMPDLNWEDATVRKAIYKSAIEFWLAKGVDGFRVDVVNLYSKDLSFPDAPVVDPDQELQPLPWATQINGPRMHEFLQEQRQQALEKYGDVVLVGECGGSSVDVIKQYLDPQTRELDMIFDFDFLQGTGYENEKPLPEWKDVRSLSALRKGWIKSQSFMSEHGLWSTTFLENHDSARGISNYGARSPQHMTQSGKLLALLIATLSGTLFIYQGQEIGMTNVPAEWPESELRDLPWTRLLKETYEKYSDDPEARKRARAAFQRCGRDHARTPVQWTTDEPYAGFSTSQPWIRVNDDFRQGTNVATQEASPDSLLSFWKKVLHFRKQNPETLIYGHTDFVDVDNEFVLSFVKHEQAASSKEKRKILAVFNCSDDNREFPTKENLGLDVIPDESHIVFSTGETESGDLQPWEGRLFTL